MPPLRSAEQILGLLGRAGIVQSARQKSQSDRRDAANRYLAGSFHECGSIPFPQCVSNANAPWVRIGSTGDRE